MPMPMPMTWSTSGQCVVTRRDGQLWIDRADVVVMFAQELLDEVAANPPDYPVSYRDGVLRIEAQNRIVAYRIGDRIGDRYWYYCGDLVESTLLELSADLAGS